MSAKVRKAVWRDSKRKGSPLLLLLAIADCADDEGLASVAVSDLAQMTRLSERCVQYMLKRLERSQELVIQRGGAGRGNLSLFRVQQGFTLSGDDKGAKIAPNKGAKFSGEKFAPVKELLHPNGERKKESKKESTNNIPLPIQDSNPINPLAPSAPADLAADIFCEVFRELNPGCEYGLKKGDWVQLAGWRKTQHIAGKAAPETWQQTCANYLSSPLFQHTLAHLCTNYATFVKGPVDRYKTPIGVNGNGTRTPFDTTLESIRKVSARLDHQDRGSGERRDSGGDRRGLSGEIELPFSATPDSGDEPHD